ncbi:hypothetical protein ACFQJC_14545 [Haloferax namakaokahaiae]|uniref:Uncharacterized protein n=1 Tax=Haloferax namakaokahaiae TaxID=1748331 RepID=A0ABD5ZHJ2_9EURY
MTVTFEFPRKNDADQFREELAEYVADSDDKRLKRVVFEDSLPSIPRDRINAAIASTEAETGTTDTVPLTRAEKRQIDFSQVPYVRAKAIKNVLLKAGVDDWLAYFDPTLSVDEHRSHAAEWRREGGGARNDRDRPSRSAAATAEKAANESCGRAADACREGYSDACEMLSDECGYTADDVAGVVAESNGSVSMDDLDGVRLGDAHTVDVVMTTLGDYAEGAA